MAKKFLFKSTRISHLLIPVLIVISIFSHAQEIKRHMEVNVIPPSPTAASFQKYIDMPVSHYTGTPEITIPLFQLTLQQLSLPISLNYHAGGLKVEERASWVGAGWSLNAGGAISRSIKGLPDEFKDGIHRGYFHTGYLFTGAGIDYGKITSCEIEGSNPVVMNGDPLTTPDSISQGLIDLEPDLFYYTTPAASGKFVFSHQREVVKLVADDVKLIEDPFSNWTFPGGSIDSTWKIKGSDGVVYTFTRKEQTKVSSTCGGSMTSPYDPETFSPTSWYLTEMAINNEWIKFSYSSESYVYTDRYTESAQFKISGPGEAATFTNCSSETITSGQRLTRIESSNGYIIYFVPHSSSRSDVPGSRRLNEVRVVKGDSPVVTFKLKYGSFSNEKLKLNDVRQFSSDTIDSFNAYHFDYYAGTLPSIDSKSQDYWGYYNGSGNSSTMIPPIKFGTYHVNQTSEANREPSLGFAVTGNLNKIVFATGGYREFEYELNNYYGWRDTTYTYSAIAQNGSLGTPDIDTVRFSVQEDCYVTVTTDGSPEDVATFRLLEKCVGSSCTPYSPTAGGNRHHFENGDYRITVQNSNGGSTYYTVEFEQPRKKNLAAGGLRVKRIINYDAVAEKSYAKMFIYTDSTGNSSGKLFTPQLLGGNITTKIPGHGTCEEDPYSVYISAAAYTNVPLSVYSNSPAGYSQVTEYQLSEYDMVHQPATKKVGMTRYTFLNVADTLLTSFPFPPLTDYSHINGKPLSVQLFATINNQLKKVKETKYHYKSRAHDQTVPGIILKPRINRFCYDCTGEDYATANYFYSTNSMYLDGESEFHFDENEVLTLNTQRKLFYDSVAPYEHYQTKESKTFNSKGDTLKLVIGRDATSPDLITESNQYVGSAHTGGEKREYLGKLVTAFYYFDFDQNVYLKRNAFEYDDGRLESVKDFPEASPLIKSYLYETDSIDLPSAEAVNALPEDIFYTSFEFEQSAVEQSTGNLARSGKKYWNSGNYNFSADGGFTTVRSDLRMSFWYWANNKWNWKEANFSNTISEGSRLDDIRVYPPGTLMRTFTYSGSGLLESITDAGNKTMVYQYDSFNRLRRILDHKKNVVKDFKYHYYNENE